MSVFTEPHLELCGVVEQDRDTVCVAEADHAGGHIWNDAMMVAQRLAWTFTPCRWRHGPFAKARTA